MQARLQWTIAASFVVNIKMADFTYSVRSTFPVSQSLACKVVMGMPGITFMQLLRVSGWDTLAPTQRTLSTRWSKGEYTKENKTEEQIKAVEDLLSKFEDIFSKELTPEKFLKNKCRDT
jgi:hypothetical protein